MGEALSVVPPAEAASSAAALGDRDWRALYRTHWEWIYRAVRRMGSGEINVEDAVQDVFVVVVDRLATFEGRSKLETWLYRICLNVVSEHRRRARRHRRIAGALEAVMFWRHEPGDARRIECRDELARVARILDGMSDKKRDVLILCDIEELTSEEAAEVLAVPAATVRTRLHHARRELMERLAREEDR